MEKKTSGSGEHEGGMSWGHDPHFLAVWRSKEVAVHLYIDPPLFTGMLTAMAACYKLLTRPIIRCDCRASNYLTQL